MLEAFTALLQFVLYAGVLSGSGAVLAQATLRPAPDQAISLPKITRWGSAVVLAACPLLTLVLILRLGGVLDSSVVWAAASNVGAARANVSKSAAQVRDRFMAHLREAEACHRTPAPGS